MPTDETTSELKAIRYASKDELSRLESVAEPANRPVKPPVTSEPIVHQAAPENEAESNRIDSQIPTLIRPENDVISGCPPPGNDLWVAAQEHDNQINQTVSEEHQSAGNQEASQAETAVEHLQEIVRSAVLLREFLTPEGATFWVREEDLINALEQGLTEVPLCDGSGSYILPSQSDDPTTATLQANHAQTGGQNLKEDPSPPKGTQTRRGRGRGR